MRVFSDFREKLEDLVDRQQAAAANAACIGTLQAAEAQGDGGGETT